MICKSWEAPSAHKTVPVKIIRSVAAIINGAVWSVGAPVSGACFGHNGKTNGPPVKRLFAIALLPHADALLRNCNVVKPRRGVVVQTVHGAVERNAILPTRTQGLNALRPCHTNRPCTIPEILYSVYPTVEHHVPRYFVGDVPIQFVVVPCAPCTVRRRYRRVHVGTIRRRAVQVVPKEIAATH